MRLAALALALGVACSHSKAIPPVPKHWLTDDMHLLAPEVVKQLDSGLEAYERRTKHQVFVWITDSAHKEPYPEFTTRVFNAWGIGREGKDDGVLLFIFTRDDMRWITVGYGLEAAISDREATRICREVIAPRMRTGNPSQAIADGIGVILADIDLWEKR